MSYEKEYVENMNFVNENIVNISMRAAVLLRDGRIERDDMTGHAGLTETIIDLAEKFEQENAGVNFNEGSRDYWLEIDAFAEKQLLERFGVEQVKEPQQLDIKVIVDRGVVDAVLKNQHMPVNVEVVDIDPDYEDYKQLNAYKDELKKDPAFYDCDYKVSHFDTEIEMEEQVHEDVAGDGSTPAPEPVSVVAVIGNTEFGTLFSGTWDECKQYCQDNKWVFWDENNLSWELEIRDPREQELPAGFYLAVDHYSGLFGADVENSFVRQHAEELVFCHRNNIDFASFGRWTMYQVLLGDKISYGEFCAMDRHFQMDLSNFSSIDKETIQKMRGYLEGCRSERKAVMSLDEKIALANNVQSAQQQTPTPAKEQVNYR